MGFSRLSFVVLVFATVSFTVGAAAQKKKTSKAAEKPVKAEASIAQEFSLDFSCADAVALPMSDLKLLPTPSSHKTKAAWKTWATAINADFTHPAHFTYQVPSLSDKTTSDEKVALVRRAILAGVLADEFVKDEAKTYDGKFHPVTSEEQLIKDIQEVSDSAGFGRMTELESQLVRVFAGKKKRFLFAGYLNANLDGISYGGDFLAVVDTEYSEINVIAYGDLFKEFMESVSDDGSDG